MWKTNLEMRKYKAAEKLKENNVPLYGGKHTFTAVGYSSNIYTALNW